MSQPLILKKVRVHNLKEVDLTLAPNQLIVFTGVSGSGKSSLAFDTIYTEGQRCYIESLSTYAKRHLGEMKKPDADEISGISPTIAIEQKTAGHHPRSTVGTMTGIYDYLRILFARVGIAHCPVSGERVTPRSVQLLIQTVGLLPQGTKISLFAPYARGKKGEFKEEFQELVRKGFTRIRLDGKLIDLSEEVSLSATVAHDIDLLIDRIVIQEEQRSRLADGIVRALELGSGSFIVVDAETQEETFYSETAFAPKSGISYPPLEPHDFSFNHPAGMCPTCQGLGSLLEFKMDEVIDSNLSIAEDCCSVASSYQTVRYGNIYRNLAKLYKFDVKTPWKKLPEKARHVFLYGIDKKWNVMLFTHPESGKSWTEYVHWAGALTEARTRYQEAKSEGYRAKMREKMEESVCSACQGQKIRPYPAATQVGGLRIAEVTRLSIDQALHFFQSLQLTQLEFEIAEEIVKELIARITFLQRVGLHYLTLDRTSPTLSGGESQRVRLAAQIGSGLVGATYILDEPSIGLHPRDSHQLLATLQRLRDQGNRVIVVEHDEEMIREADYLVDVGPLAGINGGEIVAKGTLQEILDNPRSITGGYLSGRLQIPPSRVRKLSGNALRLTGASHHNLKNVSVEIPLNLFVVVTGVSGSGKSSLISDTLYPALSNAINKSTLPVGKHKGLFGHESLERIVLIDQTSIGRTPRSNPATYIKLFDEIRDLFTALPESQARGYQKGRFSFNVKEGSCPHCSGMGMVELNMDFMEEAWVTCSHCEGRRFDAGTLAISYKGKNIFDVLEMTVLEAASFFAAIPAIASKLSLLLEVGLDYIKIGQPSPTLSGGEAQRIKLAKELSKREHGKSCYILDEPTTGLHFHDIQNLIAVLQRLVDRGNSLIVIEHQMDLVKRADWIIDLGPDGGDAGGEVIATGRPSEIDKLESWTGWALRFEPSPIKKELHISKPPFAIVAKGVCQNNLKNIDVSLPHGKILVCTGPSGSGKSSFAFETIYAEGQRRYIETLSPYARQFVKQMERAKVESIEGLMAAIAIEQKNHAGNPRSTIGTMSEAYDYLRLIYAHLGTAYCPESGEKIETISKDFVVNKLLALGSGAKLQILAQVAVDRPFSEISLQLQKEGFLRVRLNGDYYELDEEIPFDPKRKNVLFLVVDRLVVNEHARSRLFEAIEKATDRSKGTLLVATEAGDLFFNLAFAVAKTGKSYPPITPHTFSFNTESGMCPDCSGLGIQYGANLKQYKEVMQLSFRALLAAIWKEHATGRTLDALCALLEKAGVPTKIALHKLSEEKLQIVWYGEKGEEEMQWRGIYPVFAKIAKAATGALRQSLIPWLEESLCSSCSGSRLHPLARNVRINSISIADFCNLPIDEALSICREFPHLEELQDVVEHLESKLLFLQEIGLGYLSLGRSAPSLSGGETQRIRLSRQLGTALSGTLYVLDEPTIGLHPYNNERLNTALKKLAALGNTLLLVEHDPLTIAIADYIYDFGPGAGKDGGKILAEGSFESLKNNPNSLTGAYLSGRKQLHIPEKRRSPKGYITIEKGTLHNLKEINLKVPTGCFVAITGVSGSGKSTLMQDLLRPAIEEGIRARKDRVGTVSGIAAFDRILVLDQSPIGKTNRADVSSYADLLTSLRYFFAALPQAEALGLLPRQFSHNNLKGMCKSCFGHGFKQIPLQFLPSVKVACDACRGYRLNPQSLEVRYKGKHLGELLRMTVQEAREWLIPIPKVVRILDTLIAVGLGYLQLDQEIATLSGGEAGRLRLSRELSKRAGEKTLYLFDEPTIGLHPEDVGKLLKIFHALVDRGSSLIVIEHNLDLIAQADQIIDLGPDAGDKGGEVVATGTPEEVATAFLSHTAKYLAAHLRA